MGLIEAIGSPRRRPALGMPGRWRGQERLITGVKVRFAPSATSPERLSRPPALDNGRGTRASYGSLFSKHANSAWSAVNPVRSAATRAQPDSARSAETVCSAEPCAARTSPARARCPARPGPGAGKRQPDASLSPRESAPKVAHASMARSAQPCGASALYQAA
jgi:hypothetical protein